MGIFGGKVLSLTFSRQCKALSEGEIERRHFGGHFENSQFGQQYGTMAFSLMYWVNYTLERVKLRRKSEQAVLNDRVLSFTFDSECLVVNAQVQASMNYASYKIQVVLPMIRVSLTFIFSLPVSPVRLI